MLNSSTELFFFQFSSMDGLDSMLEIGLWFICNNPLILKKWNSDDGLSVVATKLGTPLMLDSYTSDMCMQSRGRSSYARALTELRAAVELKDTIVDGCPMNVGSDVAKKKNPSQAPKGISVGPKARFKPVENDVDLGTNEGTSNLASKKANSSGSSFWNVGSSSTSTTPIVEKFDKTEKLIIDGKITLVDDEGKSLKKVDYSSDHDSEDEVQPDDNEMASFLASKSVGYGTNSLLEQWRETYENVDHDYDPYDDDIYEG
ncbi:hypothetical protein Tco_1464903 [Tanacetum coccineum]